MMRFFTAGVILLDSEGLRVGMAYDYNISALNDYNDGSLEFMMKLLL